MSDWRDILSTLIFYAGLSLGCALLVHYGTTYGWNKVDESFRDMEPHLSRGHYVWVHKRARKPEDYDYGDIVMYRRPVWKRTRYDHEFARVVGKPGDVVALKKYQLYRSTRQKDGSLVPRTPEAVIERYTQPNYRPQPFSEFVVPRNTLFVMFDDRSSREALRNLLVPMRSVRGKVLR